MMNVQPADGMIAAVLSDLAKWESQEPSFNAPSKKRTLRMLPLSQGRLNQSPHKDDPSWKDAQDRLSALQARLEGKTLPVTTKPSDPTTAASPTTASSTAPSQVTESPMPIATAATTTKPSGTNAAQSLGVQQMLSHERTRLLKLRRDCESAKDRLDRKRFSDPTYLQQAISGHTRLQEQLSRYMTNFPNDSDVQASAQALQQYAEAIAQARLTGAQDANRVANEKLGADVVRTFEEIQRWGPAPFQDYGYREKQMSLLRGYQQRKEQLASADDTLGTTMKDLERLIASYQEDASTIQAALGDWRATVQEAVNFCERTPKIVEPDLPYEAAAIQTFFLQGAQYETTALVHQEALSAITIKAYIPQVQEGNHVKSLLFKLQDSIRTLQRSMQSVASNLESQMTYMDSQLDWFDSKDPMNALDQANTFLGETGDRQVKSLESMLINVQAAVAYAAATNKDDLLSLYQAIESRIAATKEKFVSDRLVAWEHVRMPKPAEPTVCSYKELEDIARTTLANPKYEGIGEIVRLLINTDKRCGLSRTEKDVKVKDVDTYGGDLILSGTETVTTWKWDEFQCCTAEAGDDDKYYLYYNTFKFFTSGSSVTPTNQWVLSGRHVSTEIAFDNIAKD